MTTPPDSAPPLAPTPGSRPYLGLLGLLLGTILVILAAVVVIVYFETTRSAQYTTAVNLAGRQRMLSQRITKGLYELQAAADEGSTTLLAQDDLRRSSELFDQTLNAFGDGGLTRSTNQQLVRLPRVFSTAGLSVLNRALAVWGPLQERIKGVLNPGVTAAQASAAAAYATDVNLNLLGLMDQLTTAVENDNARLSRSNTILLAIAGGLIALVIGIGFTLLFRRVRQGESEVADFTQRLTATNETLVAAGAELTTAKEDTDLILTTVRQGMLLLDAKYQIGAQYSTELRRLLHLEDLAGMNFLNLLQRLLPEKMFHTAKDYLDLLFDPTKKEKQLAKINPLSQVEVNFPGAAGGFETSYFEFGFRRIVRDKQVNRLFISVRDITAQVQLETRLRTEEAKKERQFEILLSILHVEAGPLREFLDLARTELVRINETFKMEDLAQAGGHAAAASDPALREKLRAVYAAIHNVKGNASALGLQHFEKSAHDFEEEIRKLLDRPSLRGEDLLAIVVRQASFRTAVDEAAELSERLGSLGRAPVPSAGPSPASQGADPLAEAVTSFVAATALRHGRKVRVDTAGLHSNDLPEAHRALVRDLLLQLTRNAVVHGIEDPASRLAAQKSPEALIRITGWKDEANPQSPDFHLQVSDDGAGLDYARIKEKAVRLGLATPAEVQAMSNDESTAFIFASGFSTAEQTTTDAGRGAGLDLVRRRVVDDLGGDIEVACEPGRSLLFNLTLPLRAPAALPA